MAAEPRDMTLSTAEMLALAVLRKDQDAIGPLLDCLTEDRTGTTGGQIHPVSHRATVDRNNLRAIFYSDIPDADFDFASLRTAYENWIDNGGLLLVQGITRVELYELTPSQLGGVGVGTPPAPTASPESTDYACDVCGNVPDAEGWLEHGRGCYTQDSDGGGREYVEEADTTRRKS